MPVFQPPPRLKPVTDSTSLVTPHWFDWFMRINTLFTQGYTGTIVTAALTGGGAQGSMTFQNGVLVAQTQAT